MMFSKTTYSFPRHFYPGIYSKCKANVQNILVVVYFIFAKVVAILEQMIEHFCILTA